MQISLHELVEVSNNSRITADIHKAVNEHFTDREKQDFRSWLHIIRDEIHATRRKTDSRIF